MPAALQTLSEAPGREETCSLPPGAWGPEGDRSRSYITVRPPESWRDRGQSGTKGSVAGPGVGGGGKVLEEGLPKGKVFGVREPSLWERGVRRWKAQSTPRAAVT